MVEPVQRRDHRGENAGKEDGHFLDRMKIEVIRLVDGFLGGKIRRARRRKHQSFAQKERLFHKHRQQNHEQQERVGQAVEPPGLVANVFLAFLAHQRRRPAEINEIHHEKDRQQQAHANQPHRPAVLRHPPERDALQETEKQRRVADGRQAAARVGDDEDEEYDVMGRHAMLVHPDPRADEQHRRAGGAKNIGQNRADP